MPHRSTSCCVLALWIVAGCHTGRDYPDASGPRYAGVATSPAARAGDTLRVVSFNIEFSNEMRRAIRVLQTHERLRDADIILLEEMTAPAAKQAADALGMSYVYYPAIYSRVARRDVGNAVLSAWPIVEDAKLILPSRSRYAKTQRIATAATIRVRDRTVRVYATHLGTPADLGREGRALQLRFIMDDAARFDRVIIGGDMNSSDIGTVAREGGYVWPTDTIPRSNDFGRLDHFFLRGFTVVPSLGTGTVNTGPGISDHRPIWIRLLP
jgi:endonuclease/exonuclease/phosphatase family metal-dependent hydrolase